MHLAQRNLSFAKDELDQYVTDRIKGIRNKSHDWIIRSAAALWVSTHGEISHESVNAVRDCVLEKYESDESHSKVLSFAKAFLKFLATTRAEPRYQTFAPYLKLQKWLKSVSESLPV